MQAFPRRELLGHSLTAGIVFAGLATIVVLNPRLSNEWLVVGAALAAGYVALRMRRFVRRLRDETELSAGVVAALDAMPWVQRLTDEERRRFDQHIRWFLAEQRITGVGVEVDDRLRANAAAGACILSFGLPHWEWPVDREILLYPDAFNDGEWEAREDGELDGQFHPQGPILFSAPELEAAFLDEDGYNVALHEYAHVLDFVGSGETDGAPSDLAGDAVRDWRRAVRQHLEKVGRNRRLYRLLENYAYSNEAEFFACITEVFFELPEVLDEVAPELYALLRRLFHQDPLARLTTHERRTWAEISGRTTAGFAAGRPQRIAQVVTSAEAAVDADAPEPVPALDAQPDRLALLDPAPVADRAAPAPGTPDAGATEAAADTAQLALPGLEPPRAPVKRRTAKQRRR